MMPNDTLVKDTKPALSQPLLFGFAATAGLAAANLYYNQPVIGLIGDSLGDSAVALVPTATQLGYAAGLFLLVPLGDMVERKRLILTQFTLLAAALLAAAWAQTAAMLVVASVLIGMSASVAQQIVPFAAHLASPEKRGATVGFVMSGLLCGILLSRTIAGFVGAYWGWRSIFLMAAPVMLLAAIALYLVLPTSRNSENIRYGPLMRSLLHLWQEFPSLRIAALTQGLLFAAFSSFWTILALRLQQPPFHIGSEGAGLFGIIGAIGILAAPLAGRVADTRGPKPLLIGGCLLAFISWIMFGVWNALAGMIIGIILFDFALQSVLISNQHIIFSLRPEARSRINTVFMTCMFLGGAMGSTIATLVWQKGGWP